MALLSLNLPVIGQSSATEDQKTRDALAAIQTDYNGNITDANVAAAAGIQESKLATGVNGLARGAFAAYRSGAVSLLTGAVVPYNAEEFDVSSWYDAATNVRYTPLVAGYYRLSWSVMLSQALTAGNWMRAILRKNGAAFKVGQAMFQTGTTVLLNSVGSHTVQANGTTDFFDVIIDHNQGAAVALQDTAPYTYFGGELVGRS